MRSFHIIVAMDADRGIGKNNQLPWRLPGDLKAFKKKTTSCLHPDQQNAVIMGRKTWDSIPEKFRPLPNRLNVVISRQAARSWRSTCLIASDLEEAFKQLESDVWRPKLANIFVIGGAEIYKQALQHRACQTLYVTQINKTFECDRFFPEFKDHFKEHSRSKNIIEHGISYFFSTYQR